MSISSLTATTGIRDEAETLAAQSKMVIYSFIANMLDTSIPRSGSDYVISIMGSLTPLIEEDRAGETTALSAALNAAKTSVETNAEREQRLLAKDRTKFIRGIKTNNPVKPPYESLYLTPNDSIEEISSIAGIYRSSGYELLTANNRPDFLATECQFMMQLIQDEVAALQTNNVEQAQKLKRIQDGFLENHLAKWAPAFCTHASQHAESKVFQGLLLFFKEFLEDEMEVAA